MPLHVFECCDCRQSFERLVSNTATSVAVECPECHSRHVERQLAMPAKPLTSPMAINCAGTGPPCGASYCGRKN